MYVKATYDCGDVMDVCLYYPGNYGAPGKPRAKPQKRTPEDIARQNYTNRVNYVRRLILCNFHRGDLHLTLNYRKDARPGTLEEAKRNLSKFLKQMRTAYKKAGHTFKFIGVTEIGKKGQALHHHLVIEDLKDIRTMDIVRQFWVHGGMYWSSMYEDGQYGQLADYLMKKETKVTIKSGEKEGIWNTYTRSRGNLTEPKVERKIMRRRRWPNEPWVKHGYLMVRDSLHDGFNPVTGYPYRHYSMIKKTGLGGGKCERNNIPGEHDTGAG